MNDGAMAGDAGWQDAELACAGLPDKLLGRRLHRLLNQLSSAPGQPVPAACGDWAATKVAYRFRQSAGHRAWRARRALRRDRGTVCGQ